jgi:hypothetical protein
VERSSPRISSLEGEARVRAEEAARFVTEAILGSVEGEHGAAGSDYSGGDVRVLEMAPAQAHALDEQDRCLFSPGEIQEG